MIARWTVLFTVLAALGAAQEARAGLFITMSKEGWDALAKLVAERASQTATESPDEPPVAPTPEKTKVVPAPVVELPDVPDSPDPSEKTDDSDDPDIVRLKKKPKARPEPRPEEDPGGKLLRWPAGLEDAHRRALTDGRPVLVRAGASWCPSCRKLSAEIEKPAVQAALAGWTLVYVDVDLQREDATKLNVVGVPALRIRTPGGRPVAAHDGLLTAEELTEWLKKHRAAAAAPPDDVLLTAGKPDAATVARLVGQFADRSPAVREAAIRRLLPYPDIGRPPVVEAFRKGRLSARLSALELLREWKAPVAELDPWNAETLTVERLASLDAWLSKAAEAPPARPEKLTAEETAAAAAQIERMLKVSDDEADAIRQRLARFGPALLPEVYARLKQAATDQHRQRLLALRYRLVADDSLALRWPGGLLRLAAADSRTRQKAAEVLAEQATPADRRLLLELFSDPDPLVREICLRGLQQTGGKSAASALVDLLADPEPNVRAAVLKQFEEDPQPDMVPKIAAYLEKEKDPDLIVHAIRLLRATGGAQATRSLIALTKHESWQVRAEAAAGIGGMDQSFRGSERQRNGNDPDARAEAVTQLIKLLDDPDAFVVSRAVEGLGRSGGTADVGPLVKAVDAHPELAPQLVEMLAGNEESLEESLPHLRGFVKHKSADVRAAAFVGLAAVVPDDMQRELSGGLQDAEGKVRIAAASAVFRVLEMQRDESNLPRRLREKRSESIGIRPMLLEPPPPRESILGSALKWLGTRVRKEDDAPPEPFDALTSPISVFRALAESKLDEPSDEDGDGDKPEEPEEEEPDAPVMVDGERLMPSASSLMADGERPKLGGRAYDRWLADFYAGKGRPKGFAELIPLLEKMLAAENAEERLVAAKALIPLGQGSIALPLLHAAVAALPDAGGEAGKDGKDGKDGDDAKNRDAQVVWGHAAELLPWLAWEEREKVFRQLRRAAGDGMNSALVMAMVTVQDSRAANLFWELLKDERTAKELAPSLERGLLQAYLGERGYSGSNPASVPARAELVRAAKPRAMEGNEWQRLTALVLLADVEADEAAEVAAKIAAEADPTPAALRRDAFQIMLATQNDVKMQMGAAVAALAGEDLERRKIALGMLVLGRNTLRTVRGEFYLTSVSFDPSFGWRGNAEPIVPEAPPGLEAKHVRPLLDAADAQTAAYAGYLLALLGERDGLEPLLRYWRGAKSEAVDRLVFRAIAALDSAEHVPVLREIYAKVGQDRSDLREFYWTIRVMSGPEVLKLRKEIRDAHGMDRLR
jgi:HEAT repeat protein/thiol-disulfide isomerase/thioredoxin